MVTFFLIMKSLVYSLPFFEEKMKRNYEACIDLYILYIN